MTFTRIIKRLPFVLISLIFFTACATPPKFENGRYINPKYQFSVKMPEGWRHINKVPGWLREGMTQYEASQFKILFLNQKSNGIIGVLCDKSVLGMLLLTFDGGAKFTEEIQGFFDKRKKKLTDLRLYA